MTRRACLVLLAACHAWVAAAASAPPANGVSVIPQPKQVTVEIGAFAIDEYCIVLVASKATRGTRRAARAIQLGIRERFGIDVPIVRIANQTAHGIIRPIWVVEPRLERLPAKTIGVKGLAFTDEMRHGGYFLRVDAVETVVHGADDAGSCYAAQTLLQLMGPPQKGGPFRRGRAPTIPCLWIRDWPTAATRPLPHGIVVPTDLWAAERVLTLAAHYKLNALAKAALPADPTKAARIRQLAAARYIRIVTQSPSPGAPPPGQWAQAEAAAHYTLAAQAETAWGPPTPEPSVFRARFARAEALRRTLDAAAAQQRQTEDQRSEAAQQRAKEWEADTDSVAKPQ